MILRKIWRPLTTLSPNYCVLYRWIFVNASHLLLLCSLVSHWNNSFGVVHNNVVGEDWVFPEDLQKFWFVNYRVFAPIGLLKGFGIILNLGLFGVHNWTEMLEFLLVNCFP